MEIYSYLIIFGILNLIAVLAARFVPQFSSPVFLLLVPVSLTTGAQEDMTIMLSLVFYFYSLACFSLAIITQFRRTNESF